MKTNIKNKMKAVVQRIQGDHNSLTVGSVDIPSVRDREVLIKVSYAALNRLDLLQAKAVNPKLPDGASSILGVEVSGIIVEVGHSCKSDLRVGDSVMALLLGGGYAQYCVCDERTVMRTLPGISLLLSSAIPEAFITAFQLLFVVGQLQPGESVVLHAAASSIGQAAIQLATKKGIKVFATTRSTDKTNVCLELGAYRAYTLTSSIFSEDIIKDNDGKLVDVILDPVGSDYISQNLDLLAVDGRWVLYGLLSGGIIHNNTTFLPSIMNKRISLLPTTLRTRSFDYKHSIIQSLQNDPFAFNFISSNIIKVNIDKVFDFDKVQEAHDYMSSNKNIGKVILNVNSN